MRATPTYFPTQRVCGASVVTECLALPGAGERAGLLESSSPRCCAAVAFHSLPVPSLLGAARPFVFAGTSWLFPWLAELSQRSAVRQWRPAAGVTLTPALAPPPI